MVRLRVNGVEVEVSDGAYIVDAVRRAGFSVPLICYLQDLFSEATCRVCVVKANNKIVPACRFPAQDGMVVVTDDPDLARTRRVNFELVLSTHRIECWRCIRKGLCILSSLSRELGVEGLPVCSECPLAGEQCFTRQGIACLGPVTISGCNAECPRQGAPCIGCRGYLKSAALWQRALEFYWESGVNPVDLEEVIKIFSPSIPPDVEKALRGVKRS